MCIWPSVGCSGSIVFHPNYKIEGTMSEESLIVATPGKVQFVGTKKAQPIRWEARRDSAVSAYFNRRIY